MLEDLSLLEVLATYFFPQGDCNLPLWLNDDALPSM